MGIQEPRASHLPKQWLRSSHLYKFASTKTRKIGFIELQKQPAASDPAKFNQLKYSNPPDIICDPKGNPFYSQWNSFQIGI